MFVNKSYSRLTCVLSILVSVSSGVTWMTKSLDDWTLQCSENQSIKSIMSTYVRNNTKTDRLWNFTCESTLPKANLTNCQWSDYVNEFRRLVHYQCPNDGLITGIASYFEYNSNDRRFKFLCCSPCGLVVHSCLYTPVMNQMSTLVTYRVPDKLYLRGVISEFNSNYPEDRFYVFHVCKVNALAGPLDCL